MKLIVAIGFAVAGLAGGALAAESPRAPAQSQTLRSFTLRNETNQPIIDAQISTTSERKIALTKDGAIQPHHAQEFMMPQGECLASVRVVFKDGHNIGTEPMNDCQIPGIMVTETAITTATGAVGGTPAGKPR